MKRVQINKIVENITEEKTTENLKKCPHSAKCSQNLCPLDFGLNLRTGNESSKCRWMRESRQVRIGGKEFVSGGGVMPNAILNFVPQSNLEWLNAASRNRWHDLKKVKINI